MKLFLISPSDQELEDVVRFYNFQYPGLGDQFLEELEQIFDLILKYPYAWKKVGAHTRKCILKRFPYSILYIVEYNAVFVTAIAHQHRPPEYFLKRIR